MRRVRGRTAVLVGAALAVGLVTRGVAAQQPGAPLGVIMGVVTDTGHRVIPAGDISIDETNVAWTAENRGRFQFIGIPAGRHQIVARSVGFAPATTMIELKDGDTVRVTVTLARSTQTLGTVTVTAEPMSARMQEFEARRKFGFGEFWSAAEIEKRNAMQLSDLLLASRTVKISFGNAGQVYATSRREGAVRTSYCAMQVFLDGMPYSGVGPGGDATPMIDLNTIVTTKEIAALEVYSGPATVPIRYNWGSQCGAILIWTKDD